MIDEMNITIPIVWIKGSMYLIGINKIDLSKKGEFVTARIGGGYEKFESYIEKNHKALEKGLIVKMIQSRESLEWVVEALINDQKIPTIQSMAYNNGPLAK